MFFYFGDSPVISQGAFGSVIRSSGERTDFTPSPFTYGIVKISFENHMYNVLVKDIHTAELYEESFYRINENVIYAMDENGEFTKRYGNGTVWNDFEGLPNREIHRFYKRY